MSQEIGESRDAWGWNVWKGAEEFASKVKSEKPFYVLFAAKPDRGKDNTFRQCFKAYYTRPPKLIGLLVWFADRANGIFDLVPELCIPPDVPLDPALLSQDSRDVSPALAEVGQKMGILLA